jgi:hypothetical protein
MDCLFIIYTKIRIFIQSDLVRFKMCNSLGVRAWVHICKWYLFFWGFCSKCFFDLFDWPYMKRNTHIILHLHKIKYNVTFSLV